MVQLLFGFNRDLATPGVVQNALRSILMTLDHVVYWCIGVVYNILFNISETTIISSDTLKAFYGRVQLILGVIMIFKISVSLLQYVINPEAFSDKKKGVGQVITRMVTMLAMLTAIVPLNIPLSADDEANKTYNYYLNQNGLLFGTMFSLQHRILKQNTIAKLVLGNTENSFTVTDSDNIEYETDFSENSNAGEAVASYVLKSFFRINVKDEINSDNINSQDNYYCGTKEKVDDASNLEKVVDSVSATAKGAAIGGTAGAIVGSIIPGIGTAAVSAVGAAAGGVIGFVGEKLFNWGDSSRASVYYKAWVDTNSISVLAEMVNANCDDYYLFSYFPVVSTICGVLLLLVFATTCLDVAIRALKLAILRLIAPIAIISYIDPKSAEKGAFSNWVKLLISTYLDLFLRLAIIYFVMFIVMEIIHGGLELPLGNGVIGLLSTVVIIIGLFYFARQAPKFITDALGLKGMMSWSGLSSVLAGAGTLRAGGSFSDAFDAVRGTAKTEADAFNQGKKAPSMFQNYSQSKDNVAKIKTGDNSMTYSRMRKNGKKLDAMGMSNERADEIHAKKFALDDEATKADAMYDSFEKGTLSNAQMDGLARMFGKFNDTTGKYELDDTGRQKAGEYLLQNKINKKSEAAKWAKYDDEVQKKVKAAGREQSFEDKYRARLNTSVAELSDLRDPDVRSAMFDQGAVQGVRNVVGAFKNNTYEKRQARKENRDSKVTARFERQEQSNTDIRNSR